MCTWGTSKVIHVIRRNHPAYPDGWHEMHVDACLAEYVQKMNDLGIVTVGCCCGHGKSPSEILVSISSTETMDREGYHHYPYRVKGGDRIIHYPIIKEQEQS